MNKISPNQSIIVKRQPNNVIQLTTIDKKRNEKINYIYDPVNDTFTKSEPEHYRKTVSDVVKNPQTAQKAAGVLACLSILGAIAGGAISSCEKTQDTSSGITHNVEYDTYTPSKNLPIAGATKYMYPKINKYGVDFSTRSYGPRAGAAIAGLDYLPYGSFETEKENSSKTPVETMSSLEKLEETGGELYIVYEDLCNALNMNEEDTMEYIENLCESPEWGNGCIDPIVFLADIFQESSNDPNKVGDSGAALGFGQFHKVAVDQVNKTYGTNYTYADRVNPYKALEMMSLLLRYCRENTYSEKEMLAMYNQGYPNAINSADGQKYVEAVYSHIK